MQIQTCPHKHNKNIFFRPTLWKSVGFFFYLNKILEMHINFTWTSQGNINMLHVKLNMEFSASKKMYAIWLNFLSLWPHSIILIAPRITFSWWVVDFANSWKWKVTSWQVCVAGKRHAVVPQGWLGNYLRVMKGKWNVYSTLGSPQWWACSPRPNRICIGCTLFWLSPF